MATEKDLEWLDDYLSNRLDGNDKAIFEERLNTDASLRSEMAIQKALIEGIKNARISGLKTMLNQTPVPGPGISSGMGKAAAWFIVAVAIGVGAYFSFTESGTPADVTQNDVPIEQPVEPAPADVPSTQEEAEEDKVVEEEAPPSNSTDMADEKKPAEAPAKVAPAPAERKAPATQPTLTPFDPTRELESSNEKPVVDEDLGGKVSAGSSIQVETDDSNRKYSFHYRFQDDKLYLLGSFEEDLYEIMEFFNNNKRTVFLYYNENFYLLDEAQKEPAPLRAISDPELLNRLKDYRK